MKNMQYHDSFSLMADVRLVLLQSTSGASKGCDKELRPFVGRTLMPSFLDRAFK